MCGFRCDSDLNLCPNHKKSTETSERNIMSRVGCVHCICTMYVHVCIIYTHTLYIHHVHVQCMYIHACVIILLAAYLRDTIITVITTAPSRGGHRCHTVGTSPTLSSDQFSPELVSGSRASCKTPGSEHQNWNTLYLSSTPSTLGEIGVEPA